MDITEVLSAHMPSGGKSAEATPCAPVTNVRATEVTDVKLRIEWDIPDDARYTVSNIVIKTGSAPVDENDGDVFVGQVAGTSYTTYNVQPNTTYYVALFACSIINLVNYDPSQIIAVTTKPPAVIYGIEVNKDSTESNYIRYLDDAVGFIAASNPATGDFRWGSWEDKFPFNKIRPVEFANGQVVAEVQKGDFTKRLDGSPIGSTSDIMIEIPPVYWSVKDNGNFTNIRISNAQINSDYRAYAHERGTNNVKGNLYIGVYEAGVLDNKLISRQGYTVHINQTLAQLRNIANAKGAGYELVNVHTRSLLQILFLLMFRDRNSQSALGNGVVGLTSPTATGGSIRYGMNYGHKTDNMYPVKFMGIENLWGNTSEITDGMIFKEGTGAILVSDGMAYSDDGASYYSKISGLSTLYGIPSKMTMHDTREVPFIPTATNGSTSTYYCDYVTFSYGIPAYGGYSNDQLNAGIFRMQAIAVSGTSTSFGTRLQYLAP